MEEFKITQYWGKTFKNKFGDTVRLSSYYPSIGEVAIKVSIFIYNNRIEYTETITEHAFINRIHIGEFTEAAKENRKPYLFLSEGL